MLALTADQLKTIFRREVDDLPGAGYSGADGSDGDCLWKDDEIYAYMTEAADAVASGALPTYAMYTIAYDAGDEAVDVPAGLMYIRYASLLSNKKQLRQANVNQVDALRDRDYGIVLSELLTAEGEPCWLIRDYDVDAIRLAPIPTAADSIVIQGYSTITTPLGDGESMPFQTIKEQRLMLTYMKYLAYDKHDAETYDRTRSDRYKAMFDSAVLLRDAEHRRQRRRPGYTAVDY